MICHRESTPRTSSVGRDERVIEMNPGGFGHAIFACKPGVAMERSFGREIDAMVGIDAAVDGVESLMPKMAGLQRMSDATDPSASRVPVLRVIPSSPGRLASSHHARLARPSGWQTPRDFTIKVYKPVGPGC